LPEYDIKRKASELLQKGRLAEAIQEFQALLEQSKRPNPAIVNLIGDIHVKQGDHANGFACFLKACKQYADEGLYHNGIAVGKKILRLDKERTEVYGTLGDLYARQGLGMDAVKFLNEYARRKEETNEFPAALAAFAQACETLADCPELNIAYGEMLERVARTEEAAANFRRAAETFAERRMEAQAEHWTNRAREVLSGEAPSPPSGDASVWELMSLRDLGEGGASPGQPAAPEPGRRASSRPGAGVHARAQWGIYDPGANPHVPPPPPLPPGRPQPTAPEPTPIAAHDLAPPTVFAPVPPPERAAELELSPPLPPAQEPPRISLVLEPPLPREAEPEWGDGPVDGTEGAHMPPPVPPYSWEIPTGSPSAPEGPDASGPPLEVPEYGASAFRDGLTLDMVLPEVPFRAVKGPTSYADPEPIASRASDGLELDLPPVPPAAPTPPPPRPARPEPPAREPAGPPPSRTATDERAAGAPSKTPPASLSDLPGIIMPPSAKKKTEPDPPPRRPARPLPGAVPADPGAAGEPASRPRPQESLVMTSFSGLYAKPEVPQPADPGKRERAIVIGDDTELVREGGDVKEVIQDFREATSQILGAGDHRAHYDLGTTYLEMELFDEAAAEFRLAASGAAFALASQEMLGYCHLRQGYIERAVVELHKGLELPNHDDRAKIGLLYNLGIACGALGREAEAIAAFRRVQALDPDFRDARTRLARLVSRGD
jgi:tetratricopeptide (TPR) repeat protein